MKIRAGDKKMKASEARKIAQENSSHDKELAKTLDLIKESAQNGKFDIYFSNLSVDIQIELETLGYLIYSFTYENEIHDRVSWYVISDKEKEELESMVAK
jgi:hypothetical protein